MKPFFIPFETVEYLCSNAEDVPFYLEGFQYDYISDREIDVELKHARIEDLEQPWTVDENPNHARRVAALVLLFQSGVDVEPVEMEVSEYNHNLSFVTDGHHRIRALQYLGAPGFYASLGGFIRLINELKRVCNQMPSKVI